MTRIYELEAAEFNAINEGVQKFITLRYDKQGIKGGDTLILQLVSEEEGKPVEEVIMKVDFTYFEGLKSGYVTCAFKEDLNS